MQATFLYRSKVIINCISPFLNKHTRVLDVGCGNGIVSYEIAKHFNCAVVGTDVNNHLIRNIDFKRILEGEKLDFVDREFDVGLFNDVLHHVPSDRQLPLIKEALRVCGKVLIFEVKPTFIGKLVDYPLNWISDITVPVPLTHRDRGEWERLFNENGITYKFYPVKKPAFWYPFINYLFYLDLSK